MPLFFCLATFLGTAFRPALLSATPQQIAAAPEVTKIEPPSWWIGLTPELVLLLTGHGLEATHVSCNLSSLRVTRTQATAGGDYLFAWLAIGPETRSGTAVCRIKTPTGPASFELPLAARPNTTYKFQGLSPGDVLYFIVPKPFAGANTVDDTIGEVDSPHDQPATGAHVAGDLHEIRGHLPDLKNLRVTALRISPLVKTDSANSSHGVTDFYAIDPVLGSVKDFLELVASAHMQNMNIILDFDLLHVGEHHPWVSKPPLAEWLRVAASLHNDPSKSSGASMKTVLDTENPLVALYLLQNSTWWVETAGLDGIHVVKDPSATNQFWRSWRAGLYKIYPHLAIVSD